MMAKTLKIDSDSVVGKLIRVWVWADLNSVDGNAVTVTESFLDRLTNKKGFARAMRSCGWLTGKDGEISFPGFSRHNGSTAKARAQTNRRVAKHRNRNADETPAALTKSLPEKRREEESVDKSTLFREVRIPDVVALYPRREKIAEAIEALAVHVRKGADLDAVDAGTRAIAAVIARLPGQHLNAFVPSADKFFRNRRWEDDPQTWLRNAGKFANGAPPRTLDLGGRRPAATITIE